MPRKKKASRAVLLATLRGFLTEHSLNLQRVDEDISTLTRAREGIAEEIAILEQKIKEIEDANSNS